MSLVTRALNVCRGSLLVVSGERRKLRTVHIIPIFSARINFFRRFRLAKYSSKQFQNFFLGLGVTVLSRGVVYSLSVMPCKIKYYNFFFQ